MRKILMFLVLIISINSLGQNPANYQYRVVYERLRGLMPDSVLHIPRYNGVPSGLRGGSSTQDGAIAGDTLNHAVYFYSGSLWNKLLSIRDTFSISTRAWRQKGIDSVVGLLSGLTDTHFGNTNLTQTANRTYAGAGFNYTFNNLGTWTYNHGNTQRSFSEGFVSISGGTAGGTGVPSLSLESDNTTYAAAILSTNGVGYNNYISLKEAAQGIDLRATNLGLGTGVNSSIIIRGDSLSINPFLGIINIDSLRTQYGDTTTWKPLVWSPHNKGVKKFNSWGEIGINPTYTVNKVLFSDATTGKARVGGLTWDEGGNELSLVLGGKMSTTYIQISEVGVAPGSPLTNQGYIYGVNDSLYYKNEDGTEFNLTRAGSSGSTPTLQQVLTAGPNLTSGFTIDYGTAGSLYLNDVNGGGLYLDNNSVFGLAAFDGTHSADFWLNSNSSDASNFFAFTVKSGAVKDTVTLIPGAFKWNQDTVATLADVRAGGGGGGSGTVTSVSVVNANGFTGSVANSTTTPAITLNLNSPSFEPWYQQFVPFTGTSNPNFTLATSGSGSTLSYFNVSSSPAIPDGWMYGTKMSTGTTSAGQVYCYTTAGGNYAAVSINSAYRYNAGAKIRFDDLSDGTETYNYFFGFGDDANTQAGIVDGAYFTYTHSASSGQWVCWTESNNSTTSTASGVTVAADTDYALEVSVYNGNAYFYINKTLVATHTTNIPSGSTRATSIVSVFLKTAGTTNRDAFMEWMAYGKRSN